MFLILLLFLLVLLLFLSFLLLLFLLLILLLLLLLVLLFLLLLLLLLHSFSSYFFLFLIFFLFFSSMHMNFFYLGLNYRSYWLIIANSSLKHNRWALLLSVSKDMRQQLCFRYVCVCVHGVLVKSYLNSYNKVYLMIFLINITRSSFFWDISIFLDFMHFNFYFFGLCKNQVFSHSTQG